MKVCFVERGNDILFQPITKQYIRSMSGMLKSATSVTEELLDERKRDRKREEGRLRSAVLDSYAVLAFLFGEAGHETIGTLFERAAASDKPLFIAAPNWAEDSLHD